MRRQTASTAHRIVLHCPDLILKGRNRSFFEKTLVHNVAERLRHVGFQRPVRSARGRLYVEVSRDALPDAERAANALQEVPGVSSVAVARWLRPSEVRPERGSLVWERIEAVMLEVARAAYVPDTSFAVRVNRVDKSLPTESQAMEQRLGAAIREGTAWERVDLGRPGRVFQIDAYPDGLHLYADKRPGVGGLPVGTTGRVLCLLSGGIDSPVAAYLLAKRGAAIDFFHLAADAPSPDELANSVAGRLAGRLSCYGLRARLFAAPYTHLHRALAGPRSGYELVLFRRFVIRAAEVVASALGAQGLVTGDSLGQVASQTMANLASTSAAAQLPLLRPLIGQNKEEIIALGRRIGTYETAIEPYEDCCALLAPNPNTRSRPEAIARLERQRLSDYPGLVQRTLDDGIYLSYNCGECVAAGPLREGLEAD